MKRNNTLYNRELVENHYKYSVTIFSNFALKSPFKALKCSFYSNGSPKRDTQEHIKNLILCGFIVICEDLINKNVLFNNFIVLYLCVSRETKKMAGCFPAKLRVIRCV